MKGRRAGKDGGKIMIQSFVKPHKDVGLSSEGMWNSIRVLCKAVMVISLLRNVECRGRKQRGLLGDLCDNPGR